MGCLWANGFRSQRQFQSRSVHPIESQQCIRYRCEEQRDQHDTNWGGRPSHQSIKAHPEHRIPTAISYGRVQHHVKTCYDIHVVMKCDRPLAQHGDSSASCKEMTIKASKPLDSISAVACTKKIISSSAYWKTSERNASRVGAVCLGLIWACGPMGHNLTNVAEHVADMWSSGYILSILSSFRTWMLHHDICKPWQQICLYPWHEMTSGERIVVKSGKSMSIAVSMRISVELRAAMARERILRGRGGRKKKRVQPGCERLHNVWRTHPQPPNPQSEIGTLATHSGRTFDSLPLIHMGKFMRKHGTSGTTMFGQRHPKIFFLQILSWTQGVWEPCRLGTMHPGVPWVKVRFVTLESRPAKLRLAWVNWVNLCELSAVHVYIFHHISTCGHCNEPLAVDDKTAMRKTGVTQHSQVYPKLQPLPVRYLSNFCLVRRWQVWLASARLSQGGFVNDPPVQIKMNIASINSHQMSPNHQRTFEICRWNERNNYETIWFHYITWHEHEKGGTKPSIPSATIFPKRLFAIYFSPTDFSPRVFHPYTSHPYTFHPQTVQPYTFPQ